MEAFEILFFNVLDRHEDGLYLSHIVYPEGRLVEFDENYFANTPDCDLILRAGYNHRDVDLVAQLVGMGDSSYVTELGARRDHEAELERQFMGNALVMGQSGLLNQRSAGMQRAVALLAARRSSRSNDAQRADSPASHDEGAELAASLAALDPLTEAGRQDLQAIARPGRAYCSDENGNVFAVDDMDESEKPTKPVGPAEPTGPSMERFPEPIHAVWRNKDFDKPVFLVALMTEPGHPDHYLTDENSGVAVSEVFFDHQPR